MLNGEHSTQSSTREVETRADARAARSGAYRWVVLAALLAVYSMNFMDRWIVTILGQPIKEELHLADWQLGLFNGLAFAVLATVLGFPLARLAERKNRVTLIAVCMAIWSAMTAACGIATGFWQLLLFRMGVGIGDAGCVPASHSLLADYFPPRMRATAHSIFGLGIPVGGLAGMILGGFIADHWGWRRAFFVVGAPGLLIALLLKLLIRETPRGRLDAAPADMRSAVPSLMQVARFLWIKPTSRHVLIAVTLAVTFGIAPTIFLPPYLVRRFGMHYAEVGLIVGVTIFGTGALGTLGGGLLSDWAGRHDVRWYLWLPAAALALAVPLNVIAYWQPSWLRLAATLLVPATLMCTYLPSSYALLHNMVLPQMRATTSAIVVLLMSLIGVGVGSLVGGMAVDFFAEHLFGGAGAGHFATACPGGIAPAGSPAVLAHACHTALADATQRMLIVWSPLMLWPALHFYLGSRSVRADSSF